MAYRIDFTSEADDQIAELRARERAVLFDQAERQLRHQPTVETRNRKPMRPNPIAGFRLRIGDLRVYYDVVEAPEPQVLVKAVGIKVGNRVYVGGKEIHL